MGELVSLEMGKVRGEGIGEVQEVSCSIRSSSLLLTCSLSTLSVTDLQRSATDLQCDYGVGLVRSMSGNILSSERPDHTIYESGS